MKRFLGSVVVLLLSLNLVSAQNKEIPGGFRELGSKMPPLKVVTVKHKTYTDRDFKDNQNFFVMLFNPTCDHCLKMTKLIGTNSQLFKNHHVLFLASPQMIPYLYTFEKETEIYKHPEMIVGVDSSNFIDRVYEYKSLPQMNIYNKERKLIKVYSGETPLDSLKLYLKD